VVEGHEFVLDNVVVYLHRIRKFAEVPLPTVDRPLPPLEQMPLLDESGAWILRMTLTILNGDKSPKLIEQAMNEIDLAKKRLGGVVDLVIPDRLSMDTKAR
jgi:hypothetical protein